MRLILQVNFSNHYGSRRFKIKDFPDPQNSFSHRKKTKENA